MSKSDKHLGQLVNRLRTAANVLEKEGEVKKARAACLRAVAREVEGWLKQGGDE